MTPESLKQIKTLLDRTVADLRKVSGFDTYEDGITALRVATQTGVIPVGWLRQLAGRVYSKIESNSVRPEDFEELLVIFDTKEKAISHLANLPEELVPAIKAMFRQFRSDILPTIREAMLSTAKQLPYRRSGGRPKTMPNQTQCKQICREIAALLPHVGVGVAQRRIAERRGFTLRMIQRIWQERTRSGASER
jgi:hypothetical protein